MGLSTATIERLAGVAPLEREGEWPPMASLPVGTRAQVVGRWDEENEPAAWVKWLCRFVYLLTGGKTLLASQDWHFIGVASTEEAARAACPDETYFSFPATVDHFLPRERVNQPGLRFWKRRLHKLFWHPEPKNLDPLLLVRESELKAVEEILNDALGVT
jgi:hypothetical protein